MPTCNRREFIGAAIECWQKQTYRNRELIILDDGESVKDLVPDDKRIQYIFDPVKRPIGTKRNSCCRHAQGEIICHWDDDDWSAPDRIEFQLAQMRQSGKPIAGFHTLYFWDIAAQVARRYRSAVNRYVVGTSLFYRKDFWEIKRFKDVDHGEDNEFVYASLPQIAATDDASHMVARIHDSHTSNKSGIIGTVDKNLLPVGFWDNERLVSAL